MMYICIHIHALTSVSASIGQHRGKYFTSDFLENVAREIERAAYTSGGCQSTGHEMSTSSELLDNGDRRVKWKIFEDRDASMPEL